MIFQPDSAQLLILRVRPVLHFLRWVQPRGCLHICLLAPGDDDKEEDDGDNDDDDGDSDDNAGEHDYEAASRFAYWHLVIMILMKGAGWHKVREPGNRVPR